MKTFLTFTLILLSLAAGIAGFGCAALSEYVTPARLEPRAIDYVVNAGVADPVDFSGYQNLEKALRLESAVNSAHQTLQFAYQQMAEKDQLNYAILNDLAVNNRTIAQAREAALFGGTGLLSIGLTALGFGSFTGILGLLRKRPQDITPEEMETTLTDLHGELSEKDRQLLNVIKGVQIFLNADQDGKGPNATALKNALTSVTDSETKTTIAAIKAKENL